MRPTPVHHQLLRSMPRLVTALVVVPVLIGSTALCWSESLRNPPLLGLQEQGGAPAAIEPQQQPSAPPAHEDNPGLLREMGKLFDKMLPLKKTGDVTDQNAQPAEVAPDSGTGGKNALQTTAKRCRG